MEDEPESSLRWATTPTSMKTPVRTRPERPTLKINTDQRKLDHAYMNFSGRDGHKLLSEETKWLAVTSKSFDHGRRGFNDRLAVFEQSGSPSVSESAFFLVGGDREPWGHQPFRHPATEAVEGLLGGVHQYFTHHKALSDLAVQYGIPEVVRWHPRFVSIPSPLRSADPTASGADLVYSQALLAIIGALALEPRGAVANRMAKERVLTPMDLKRDWKPKVAAPETSAPS
ncbi:uncharacterized protein Z518_02109 [Rhinocladiella mackenziei CBS 650.93]|uniref:RNase III domain-containing protein n=1 Tax=Rhinocladiella mackenziei CBS 650.93 TaxID=1442369 RepID=A0A0D2IW35_9EURO|nr:uncharacterized protein Z518_02109 [Rhinocladiella mackenziei CBS 650.93]KIX07456.1 hypothetical protein Z518_02109 [Rhinocladiella mackenziei CBS 650.93]